MADEATEELDLTNEAVDDTDIEEVVDTAEESADDSQPDVDKLQETNKKLFNRAKTAEAEAKALKEKLKAKEEAKGDPLPINKDSLSREEAILIAQGMDADDLDELKDVATAKGLPLLKAKETKLFQAYMDKKAADAKKEKAKLGTSSGSQVQQEQKIGDLPRDEHQALAKEMMSKVR